MSAWQGARDLRETTPNMRVPAGTTFAISPGMRSRLDAGLYEIWFSRGTGIQPGPKFKLLQDARRYVADHAREASHAIRGPDGHWEPIQARVPWT